MGFAPLLHSTHTGGQATGPHSSAQPSPFESMGFVPSLHSTYTGGQATGPHSRAQRFLPGSDFGKAVKYVVRNWDGLVVFLDAPAVPIDNNRCDGCSRRSTPRARPQ
jgi:hypothetical protein